MVKLLRRLVAGAAASLAMHPVAQAAPPLAEPMVEVEQDSDAKTIAEHPMAAVGVRKEYLSAYSGPTSQINGDLLRAIRSSRRFRNATVDAAGARAEFEKFIQERTR